MKIKLLLTYSFLFLTLCVASEKVNAMPAVTTTQIQASQCGQVLAALNTNIVANIVAGATSYRFKVSTTLPNGSALDQVVTNSMRVFTLLQLGTYSFATTYQVQVSAYCLGAWQPYGSSCTIISPSPITMIQSSQCGITMTSISDPVYANLVSYAPGYRFKVSNVVSPSEIYLLDSPLREFRLNLFPVISGATYNVQVAVKNFDGTYLPYGPTCSVTSPILYTKIQSTYCGRVLGAFSDYIYADYVQNCTGYRFKITNMSNMTVQYLDSVLREMTLMLLPNIQYNTAYRIEVSIKDTHGDYLPYGPFCTIFTPLLPVPKIQLSQCEMTAANITDMMYADDYPGATVYRFRLENYQSGYSHYVDRTSRCYNLSMFTGLQPNTAYTVKVAVKLNGVFTGFGKACDVTTPATLPATKLAYGFDDVKDDSIDAPFMPRLYPNPFSEYFSIDATLRADAEVSVKVYDMTGRLLDAAQVTASDVSSLKMGEQYPPGVYNVVISVNGEVKTLHVIKR